MTEPKVSAGEFLKDEIPEYIEMFRELASRVGKNLDEIIVRDGQWPYDKYEWTEEEEKDYGKWLVDYVYKNRQKFKKGYATKRLIANSVVPCFLLAYSWKYKEVSNG